VYVANSNPDGIDHDLEYRSLMAFTLCYVASHLALELLGEEEAEKDSELLRTVYGTILAAGVHHDQ
jgi:hypothetical protein